jgi:two-component system, response regulator
MTESSGNEILLVEDNPRDAELTLRVLQEQHVGNETVWVKDGAACLEYIFGTENERAGALLHGPRLILLDLKLPKVDGLEVLRQLKGDDRTKAIPVVVLTSSREERDVLESYKLGVNSYLVKPVQFDAFCAAVAQIGLYWLLLNHSPEL